jgi:hypothetical protein
MRLRFGLGVGFGERYRSGFQPSCFRGPGTWGFVPGWYRARLLALGS